MAQITDNLMKKRLQQIIFMAGPTFKLSHHKKGFSSLIFGNLRFRSPSPYFTTLLSFLRDRELYGRSSGPQFQDKNNIKGCERVY